MLIVNDGPAVSGTDYFDSPPAKAGYLYLSWNVGAARLLLPDNRHGWLNEMATASEVIISRGPWSAARGRDALELMFEDGSDAPFAIRLTMEQTDRLPTEMVIADGLDFHVLTRNGQVLQFPARYRRVGALPCMAPWI
ncbi:hypothetical protein [Aromatoleum evansii]|uniref:hypothetical protein n=1 Tax=Aromatoleum evansii TaxID=59406 RepID=UPI00145CC3EF|nr:hypothetical protein [Aromatoleum evansii]NMG30581.1 hypothetical protein [Aromatoleum evansii]